MLLSTYFLTIKSQRFLFIFIFKKRVWVVFRERDPYRMRITEAGALFVYACEICTVNKTTILSPTLSPSVLHLSVCAFPGVFLCCFSDCTVVLLRRMNKMKPYCSLWGGWLMLCAVCSVSSLLWLLFSLFGLFFWSPQYICFIIHSFNCSYNSTSGPSMWSSI